jgi:hypothetical protein
MRTKMKREIRIEVMENAAPMEEALNRLAKVIAAGMIREEQETEEKE